MRNVTLSLSIALLAGCTVDKLEARLQADPQCKSVMSPKTGALMPCPGTDKEFYRSIPGLSKAVAQPTQPPVTQSGLAVQVPTAKAPLSPSVECKPQLHQKSGSLMPCPAP